jgi:hypothetical protein
MKTPIDWVDEWKNDMLLLNEIIPSFKLTSLEIFVKEIQNDALEEAKKCCEQIMFPTSNITDLLIKSRIDKLIRNNNGTNDSKR